MIQKLGRDLLDVLDELLDLRRGAHEVDLKLYRLLLGPEQAVGTREILVLMALRQLHGRNDLFDLQLRFHSA